MITLGDRQFEDFCARHGARCARVSESTERRPDYSVHFGAYHVIAEVKTLEPNEEEAAVNARRARGEIVAGGGKPGERLRREIRSANGQLRSLSSRIGVPTLLVVHNNTGCSIHTDPYSVMTAMQGMDCVDINIPAEREQQPSFGATRYGPERAMRRDANTSTSGIAIIGNEFAGEVDMALYHNMHAATPLDPEQLRIPGIRQFRIPPDVENSIGAPWLEV